MSFKVPLGWANLHVHDPRSLQNATKRCFACRVTQGAARPKAPVWSSHVTIWIGGTSDVALGMRVLVVLYPGEYDLT